MMLLKNTLQKARVDFYYNKSANRLPAVYF
jgi:hypothetical protein